VPAAEAPSVFAHDSANAVAAGLHGRPLRETVTDTWAWQQAGWQPTDRTPGLDAAKEAALLKQWHAR
jgi:uncharacterized protein YjdB